MDHPTITYPEDGMRKDRLRKEVLGLGFVGEEGTGPGSRFKLELDDCDI